MDSFLLDSLFHISLELYYFKGSIFIISLLWYRFQNSISRIIILSEPTIRILVDKIRFSDSVVMIHLCLLGGKYLLIVRSDSYIFIHIRVIGLGVWFLLRVQEVRGSIPRSPQFSYISYTLEWIEKYCFV